jgi:pyruvate/2-oxoglutarate dehydrogenase complex dihydrolipoamide dehydrogenase (E3) component
VKALYGNGFRKGDISLQDVSFRVNAVISRETEVIRAQLKRNGIAIHEGRALFLDPHMVEVENRDARDSSPRRFLSPAALDRHAARKSHSTTIELWTWTICRI